MADQQRPLSASAFHAKFTEVNEAYHRLSHSRAVLMNTHEVTYQRELVHEHWENKFSELFPNRLSVVMNNYPPENEAQKILFMKDSQNLLQHGTKDIEKLRALTTEIPFKDSNEMPFLRSQMLEDLATFEAKFDAIKPVLEAALAEQRGSENSIKR